MSGALLIAVIILLFTPLLTVSSHSATWTVDNQEPGAADFDNLQTAINTADDGDTLIIAGSSSSYGNITLNKELHLIGPGWYHNTNFPDASPMFGAIIDRAELPNISASGSSLRSLQIETIDADDCGDLLIERISPTFETGQIYLQLNNINGATIRQCYRLNVQGGTAVNDTRNLKVYNNYIVGTFFVTAFSSEIYHNVINGYLISSIGATFRYNIHYGSGSLNFALENCLAEYNIANAIGNVEPWPGETNINSVDTTTIFTGGVFGSQWRLQSESPAINIDGNGTNAGIFGGDHPYVLSGMPAVPVIYHVDAPITAGAGDTITISFKATAEPEIEED